VGKKPRHAARTPPPQPPSRWRPPPHAHTVYGPAPPHAARAVAPQHAEDAVQDAWISVYGAIKEFEGRSGLKTWLETGELLTTPGSLMYS